MQHIFDYGAERRGVTLTCKSLKESMANIELMESNGSRRYKLLKYVINNILDNPDYLLEYRETENFRYKFDNGKLFINNKEVKE